MIHKTLVRTVLLVLLSTLLLPVAGWAACDEPPPPVVADVENAGNMMIFHPLVPFAELTLTVTGPAHFEFSSVSEGPALEFVTSAESIDGCYTYELRVTPEFDSSLVQLLEEARESGDMSQVDQLRRDGILPSSALVQSGGFHIEGGNVILDDQVEDNGNAPVSALHKHHEEAGQVALATDKGFPYKDQVILDDLIVDGSACIGFDCTNGMSFGFDTVRLMENNLRLKFDDTSAAASFPKNDWQLTANESANGGLSKFSIDDITGGRTPFTIEAGAKSHSLYVDSGGRVGNKTSTPSVSIHSVYGDSPALRLQQDGSSGFKPQTWDVVGNEANFMIRDATNNNLPFRIRPKAPENSLVIAEDGKVGFGTKTPDAGVDIEASSSPAFRLTNTSTNGNTWNFLSSDSGNFIVSAVGSNKTEFRVAPGGNVTIAGTLTASGQTFPDYVFEDDYELMDLEQLAQFIEDNGHLPNVPSAAETDNGRRINMTELQILTLEKVEELVLYTLQQQDTITGQQQTIDQLLKRLSTLEETVQP